MKIKYLLLFAGLVISFNNKSLARQGTGPDGLGLSDHEVISISLTEVDFGKFKDGFLRGKPDAGLDVYAKLEVKSNDGFNTTWGRIKIGTIDGKNKTLHVSRKDLMQLIYTEWHEKPYGKLTEEQKAKRLADLNITNIGFYVEFFEKNGDDFRDNSLRKFGDATFRRDGTQTLAEKIKSGGDIDEPKIVVCGKSFRAKDSSQCTATLKLAVEPLVVGATSSVNPNIKESKAR